MPTCPGCGQSIGYYQLTVHQRYCDGIGGDEAFTNQSLERFEHRLMALESRIDQRLNSIEGDVEQRLSRLEATRRPVRE